MSIIEKAAKRLEELRRAGAETADGAEAGGGTERAAAAPEPIPTPEAAIRELSARVASAASVAAASPPASTEPAPVIAPPIASTRAQMTSAADDAVVSTEPAARREQVAQPARRHDAPTINHQQARVEIDLAHLKTRGFVTPDAPKSQIADEFRVIKRPIIQNAKGAAGAEIRYGNLVMVTSALPGEGKTFTALNLAISVAMEMDSTVLLVDGDVAHPELPNLLGVPEAPGLLDVLTRDDIDVGDALLRTNIEKLSVLPAGSHHRRATELLASEQMAILLRELATRYPDRIIIFDSPPLLATTEARVLASHMGQIVMVVAANSTGRRAVEMALETVENCEIVLMMLNKADKTDVGTYYGYYADDEPR